MENLHQEQIFFYEQMRREGKSHNSLKNYHTDLECFAHYLLQNPPLQLEAITTHHIQEYGKYLQQKYQSDNSRRRRVQTLRRFFDFLVQREIFGENLVKKIPVSPKYLDIPRPTPLKELTKVWQHLQNLALNADSTFPQVLIMRNQVLIALIYTAALKVSDVVALKEKHLFQGSTFRVMATPAHRDPYSIPLPPILSPLLQRYLELLKEVKKSQKITFPHLFFNANHYKIISGGLSARGQETIFAQLRQQLALDHLSPKALRQAAIFHWLQQKVSIGQIKEWLGVAPSYDIRHYCQQLPSHIYNYDFLQIRSANY